MVTYTAVIAVRYPELDNVQNDLAFGNSEWVTQSEGAVQSKSVTSCAGMTAHFVLLAQTKVGFLSGGRSRRMKELPEKEVLAQLEEAYARATVALTRAQKLCIIMGPLDMRGLLGAATVIGCLKYGEGCVGCMSTTRLLKYSWRKGPTPSFEGTLKVHRRSCLPTSPPPLRRSEALRVPLRYPLRYPLRSPLRYPLRSPLRYPLRYPLRSPLKGTLKVPLQGTLQGYP